MLDQNIFSFEVRVNYLVLCEQHEHFRNFNDYFLEDVDILGNLIVKWFVNNLAKLIVTYLVDFLAIMFVSTDIIQAVSKRTTTFFVEYPSILLVYFVRIHLWKISNARMFSKFRSWKSSQSKKFWSKPNLLHMSLMVIFSYYLFDSKQLWAPFMLS